MTQPFDKARKTIEMVLFRARSRRNISRTLPSNSSSSARLSPSVIATDDPEQVHENAEGVDDHEESNVNASRSSLCAASTPSGEVITRRRTEPVAYQVGNEKPHQPYSRDGKARKPKEEMESVAHKKRQKAGITARNDFVFVVLVEGSKGVGYRKKENTPVCGARMFSFLQTKSSTNKRFQPAPDENTRSRGLWKA
ncbi:hypothetical protein MMC22_007872 [Lobaria immixta]|nr:hypothetical protein [Lobaria immixta]